MLTAVGNDGSIYVMEKESDFDVAMLKQILGEFEKKYPEYKVYADDHLAMVEEFLRKARGYGLHLYTSRD